MHDAQRPDGILTLAFFFILFFFSPIVSTEIMEWGTPVSSLRSSQGKTRRANTSWHVGNTAYVGGVSAHASPCFLFPVRYSHQDGNDNSRNYKRIKGTCFVLRFSFLCSVKVRTRGWVNSWLLRRSSRCCTLTWRTGALSCACTAERTTRWWKRSVRKTIPSCKNK